MNKMNFLIGMGMGIAVGSTAAMLMRPKKNVRSALGRTLKSMSEVADSITDTMGW